MQSVILAGGLATRLGSLTKETPKSLITIHGKPFLEYQLGFLARNGVKEVVVCLGHLGEQIEQHFSDGSRYGVNIRYSWEDAPLGTAGALKNAEPMLADTFFTVYGDSYVPMNFLAVERYWRARNTLALMTVYRNNGAYDRSNTVVDGDAVVFYSKTETRPNMVYIDYGVNFFQKQVLDMIPEKVFGGLEDLLPKLIDRKQLLAYEVQGRFYEIGSPGGLHDFERYIAGTRHDSF